MAEMSSPAVTPDLLIGEIQSKLDQLAEMLRGPEQAEPEMNPQTDDEVMAGLAPTPKQAPEGSPFGAPAGKKSPFA